MADTLYSSSARIAQLDADGHPDLIFITESQIGFALGRGDGTFTDLVVAVSEPYGIGRFDIADVNHDGRADLVVAVRTGSQPVETEVRTYLFTGTGFTASPTLAHAGYPGPVRLADMNNDGNLDLLYAHDLATSIALEIRHGDGAGGFVLSETLVGDSTVYSIEAFDLNGDGILDVVAPAYQEVSVWNSTPTGYAAVASYPAIDSYGRVAVGDVTGDGKADFIAPSNGDLFVFTNQGTGTFTAGLPIALAGDQGQLKLADLDEDGKPDIVLSNAPPLQSYGGFAFLINQGGGNFSTATGLGFESSVTRPSVVDLDHDGHLDLVAGLGPKVWFRGTGMGTFFPGRRLEALGKASSVASVAFSDLDGDGRPDLVAATSHGISVILNDRTATPFPSYDVQAVSTGYQSHGARWSDLDEDGRLDLIGAGRPGPSPQGVVSTLLGMGSGEFAASPTIYEPGITWNQNYNSYLDSPLDLTALADLNNDGRQDLVLLGEANPGFGTGMVVQSMLAGGDGMLTAVPLLTTEGTGGAIVVGDFDSDGNRDLIIPDRYVRPPTQCVAPGVAPCSGASQLEGITAVHLRRGLGTGEFEDAGVVWSAPYGPIAVAALDADTDGKLDIVIDQEGMRTVLIGRGDGTFAEPRSVSQPGDEPHNLVARDLNGDSRLDLLAVTHTQAFSSLSLGDGTFAPPVAVPGGWGWPAFADFNGDGNLDVVAQNGAVHILLGRGDGTFDEPLTFLADGTPGGTVSTGDVDGDGYVDILVEGAGSDVSILRGGCR